MFDVTYSQRYRADSLSANDQICLIEILKTIGFLDESEVKKDFWETVSQKLLSIQDRSDEYWVALVLKPNTKRFEIESRKTKRFNLLVNTHRPSGNEHISHFISISFTKSEVPELARLMEDAIASNPLWKKWEKISS